MLDNSMIFTDKSHRPVRVVFEPDGTPLFCGLDVAALQGYKAPGKMVQTMRGRGVSTEKRMVECVAGTKKMVVFAHCCTAENAMKILAARPKLTDAARWFVNAVIPEAMKVGREKAGTPEQQPEPVVVFESEQEPEPTSEPETVASGTAAIAARLDAIILECALLKRDLCHMK